MKKVPKKVKAWAVVPRRPYLLKKYPHNWNLSYPVLPSKKKANEYNFKYVSIGMEGIVLPCIISFLSPKQSNKKVK